MTTTVRTMRLKEKTKGQAKLDFRSLRNPVKMAPYFLSKSSFVHREKLRKQKVKISTGKARLTTQITIKLIELITSKVLDIGTFEFLMFTIKLIVPLIETSRLASIKKRIHKFPLIEARVDVRLRFNQGDLPAQGREMQTHNGRVKKPMRVMNKVPRF